MHYCRGIQPVQPQDIQKSSSVGAKIPISQMWRTWRSKVMGTSASYFSPHQGCLYIVTVIRFSQFGFMSLLNTLQILSEISKRPFVTLNVTGPNHSKFSLL